MRQALGHRVIERGWLSANNIVLHGEPGEGALLIDSGHSVHAAQTVALVRAALNAHPAGPQPLTRLVNTHLHSDHCGGNAALQAHWRPRTAVPPGHADAARRWDLAALSYAPTGQRCDRFRVDAEVVPGDILSVGGQHWEALAAPGHDPHSLMFFNAAEGVLIAADALWENGFGVVFPELDGVNAFDEVAATLDLIERLPVCEVVPGHGAIFSDVAGALQRARRRLAGFRADPRKHARYAAKVLVKYHLMEVQRTTATALETWVRNTPLMLQTWGRTLTGATTGGLGADTDAEAEAVLRDDPVYTGWCRGIVDELLTQGALQRDGDSIADA
jgi:glyoxylase-like metal-dependent hydrolase (beta-lactamase superfamily II)